MGRKDGRRVEMTGLGQLCIDLKPNRSVSDVYINQKMDVTNLTEYLAKKKEEGIHYSYFHAYVAAIGKLLYNRPYMNRFVANRHIYEHNDVTISFVAKEKFDDTSEEVMVLVKIDPEDTIDSISKKIADKVSEIRDKKMKREGANGAIDVLGKLPNIIRVPIVGVLKWCDKKGILPSSLIQDNLYYSSIILSNLGSIDCGAIFHNITDFGACSSLATMGKVHEEEIINEKSKKEIRKICEFGVNLDERIADGYYFAKSLNMLRYIIENPKLLEEAASTKIEMDEIR